ncbi:MAG: guanylate kinase [Oscillospiraceae bacterium]|nr:guanylate kinase [Oscillospiraceae bacterium]
MSANLCLSRNKGILFVISGPSGCGKGTVLKKVMSAREKLRFSVSATTRAPREGEVNGRDYYFVSREEFEKLLSEGQILEYTQYNGNYYGTPRRALEELLEAGNDVALDIDVVGAINVKKMFPSALLVFLMPPSFEELRRRLYGRGTESPEVIENRLKIAEKEFPLRYEYDFRVLNDDVERSAGEIALLIDIWKKALNR